jgi:L-gulonolactone oxidase
MFWATQSKPIERVDTSVKIFNFDCLFAQYVNEWSIPWSRTAEALKALDQFIETGIVKDNNKDLTSKAKKESPLKVHFPIEIRFVKKDEVWLSPAYGVDSCYIGIIMYR